MSKQCEVCDKPILGRIRAHTKYCSVTCGNRAKAKALRKDIPIKVCLNCDCDFLPSKSGKISNEDKLSRFCSNKCASEYQTNSNNDYSCECCGSIYKLSASKEKLYAKRFCSDICSKKFLREENSPAYKGGFTIHSSSGKKMILVSGKDIKNGKREIYIAEGRLVAAKAIGRPLLPSEVVIHINDDPLDVTETNLFICDIGTSRKIKWGTYKIEVKSNLDSYS